ncbi:MAG: 5-oxoprolinase subunit PxpB [Rudaea sp.]
MALSFPLLRPMGEAALLVVLGEEIDERTNSAAHHLARYLSGLPGVVECVPAYASLLIETDPLLIAPEELGPAVIQALQDLDTSEAPGRVIEIPTRYGGEYGPDLEFVAKHSGLTPEEVVRIHTSQPLRVFMLGFSPGFPYIGPLPQEIAAPRLATPRTHVPAGSVGIAGRQTGIYPGESPGGWRLIGQTGLQLFDPAKDPPVLLRPGDYVRFRAIEE